MFGKFFMTAALGLSLAFLVSSAHADNNLGDGYESSDAPSALKDNFGQVLCTAALNSDGSLVSGHNTKASTTYRISTGRYQVAFKTPCNNIQASQGFARWVQPDTLTDGSTGPVFCGTANRAGVNGAVWVECYDSDGVAKDTSFFLFVTR